MTHALPDTDAAAHCEALLRQRDEDRWLAAGYAPRPLKRRLIALYAFYSELRRIPGAVSEPPLGEIRLQWHRDALDEIAAGAPPRRQPVIEEAAAAGLADPAIKPWLDGAIDAAARPLYGEPFSDADDLLSWLRAASGGVDAAAIRLSAGHETLADTARNVGAAFAAAREVARLAPDVAAPTRSLAASIWAENAPALRAAPSDCLPAIAHLFLTPIYIKRSERAFPIVKRLRLFAAAATGR